MRRSLDPEDGLISVEELAEFLKVPVKTIYSWRHRKAGPPALRVGKHLRFRMNEVQKWLSARRLD
ncbi:MAG: helix-turn-helix domain-containing protein [Actinomycetota bacterium]